MWWGLFLILLVAPSAQAAAAKQYYVGPAGNNQSSGTSPTQPFATIQHAVDLAQPGDTVNLLPGIYGQSVEIKKGGVVGNPITVAGAGMGTTILDGADLLPNDTTGDGKSDWVNCKNGLYRYPLPAAFDRSPLYRFTTGDRFCATDLPEYATPLDAAKLPEADAYSHDPEYTCRREAVWQQSRRLKFAPHPLTKGEPSLLPTGTYHLTQHPDLFPSGTFTPVQKAMATEKKTQADQLLCPGLPAKTKQSYLYVHPVLATEKGPEAMQFAMPVHARFVLIGSNADHIVLRDLTVQRAGTDFQTGAITIGGDDWRFERVEVRENAMEGFHANRPPDVTQKKGSAWFKGLVVIDSRFSDNGFSGFNGGYLMGMQFIGNEVDHNNWQRESIGDFGSGAKFPATVGCLFQENTFHHNYGPGLWFDTYGTGLQIRANQFFANFARHLHFEVIGPQQLNCQTGCCIDTQCLSDTCFNVVEGNVFVGESYLSAYSNDPMAAFTIRQSRAVRVRENLFIGNRAGLLFQSGNSTCFRNAYNQVEENTFLAAFKFHSGYTGSSYANASKVVYCVANNENGMMNGASCPGNGKWAQICDGVACGPQYTTTAECKQLNCAFSTTDAFDDPAAQNFFDKNLYGTRTDFKALSTLFANESDVTADYYFQQGKGEYIYNWNTGKYPKDPYKYDWHIEEILAAPAGGFLWSNLPYDLQASYQPVEMATFDGTYPFHYSAPETAGSDESAGRLHLFRLPGKSGQAFVTFTVAAVGATPEPLAGWRVTHNGRSVNDLAGGSTQLVGKVPLSRWANWFVVSAPRNYRLASVTIDPDQSTCPVYPPAPNDPTCNNIDDDCDGSVDEDCVPSASTTSPPVPPPPCPPGDLHCPDVALAPTTTTTGPTQVITTLLQHTPPNTQVPSDGGGCSLVPY